MTIEINLASPDFKANPYPTFAQTRAEDPVHQVTLPGDRKGWLITRYDDAELVLRDQRFVKDVRHALTPEEIAKQFPWQQQQENQTHGAAISFNRNMLGYDPPDHTRLRALVNITFTPRLVEQWRGRIQAIADELLAAVEGKDEVDLIDAFAFPLPMTVITEMLGVPGEDRGRFRTWSNMIIEASGRPEDLKQRREQITEFNEYLVELINKKRRQPADDLLSHLVRVESEGDKLSEKELIAMVFLLLIAGHETTVNLIGNGTLALLLHPDQMEKLKQDPTLLKTAIEEFLRFHGPLMTATQRWAREDIELDGTSIYRGDYVIVVLASANHDPAAFTEPDDLDVTRQENRHLAFGKGIHYCLGAPLARLEGQVAIATLLRRFPHLRLAVPPEQLVWRPGALIMGLRSLPVTL